MTFHDHEQAFTTTCRGEVTLDAIDRYCDGLMLDDCTADQVHRHLKAVHLSAPTESPPD